MPAHQLNPSQRTVAITHITSPYAALKIITGRKFLSCNNYHSYDGGMNFIGVLGQNTNTRPRHHGAKVHCTWVGLVSEPVSWNQYHCDEPNVLYDFNGSGDHFQNNDPRYFLPYRSSGLVVNHIEFDDERESLESYISLQDGLGAWLYWHYILRAHLRHLSSRHVSDLQKEMAEGHIKLSIERGNCER